MAEHLVTQPTTLRRSVAEYLADDSLDAHCELVAGEVVPMSPVNAGHMDLVTYLTGLLRVAVRRLGPGRVLADPFQVQLDGTTCRAPDLAVVLGAAADFAGAVYVGGPDLVIEVSSPSTRSADRGEKFFEYEAAGVREYWILDPQRRVAEFYRRSGDGFLEAALPSPAGRYDSSALPGLWFTLDWFWTQPDEFELFRAWGFLTT